jgi:hypothetical protein
MKFDILKISYQLDLIEAELAGPEDLCTSLIDGTAAKADAKKLARARRVNIRSCRKQLKKISAKLEKLGNSN